MSTRLLDAPAGLKHAPRPPQEAAPYEEPNPVVLHAAITSWRAWLNSGAHRVPIDSGRARGADSHVKKILMSAPSGAVDFSSAMGRQAIDAAMNELPTQHRQVVKLAYFGGLTNRQIAQQLGLTLGGVRGRLKESLAILGAHLERGRAMGRRAMRGLVFWFNLRRFGDGSSAHRSGFDQALQAAAAAVVTVTAVVVIGTHDAVPGRSVQPSTAPRIATAGSPGSALPRARYTSPQLAQSVPVVVATPLITAVPSMASLPIKVQVPVRLPVKLPTAPALPKPVSHLLQVLGA